MRSDARALGAFFVLLGGLSLALALLLNGYTLHFVYADGRLVRDALSRIHTVQAGFALLAAPLLGIGALLRRPAAAAASPRLLNGTLAAAPLLYLPLVAELLLSLQLPGVYGGWDPFGVCRTSLALEDRLLGHVLNPALDRSYHINRRGFRGPDFDDAKAPGELRILTVGDSITFGWEISDDADTYPGQLQALLDARPGAGRRYRVINAGVPRYTSEQVLRFVRERAAALQPDIVVACVGWNDLAYSYSPDWYPRISLGRGPLPRLGRNAPPCRCRSFSPHIVRVVRHWKGEDQEARPGRHRTPNPGAAPLLRENLLELAALLREREVPLLLVNLPTVLSRQPMSERERELAALFPELDNLAVFDGVVREVCREGGLPCVLDAFPLEEPGKGAYFYDHCHLNRAGNAILARRVLEAIGRDERLARLLS